MNKDFTIDYYNNNSEQFKNDTVFVDFSETQKRFLNKLEKNSYIMDLGCGAGRDTLAFSKAGYDVLPIDASEKMCEATASLSGINASKMMFEELDFNEEFDGIWACASILHTPKKDLPYVLEKMAKSLKINGYMYISFKYGEFEGERNGRYFSDFTERSFGEYLKNLKMINLFEHWITEDVRKDRGGEKWLNLILKKLDIQ